MIPPSPPLIKSPGSYSDGYSCPFSNSGYVRGLQIEFVSATLRAGRKPLLISSVNHISPNIGLVFPSNNPKLMFQQL